MFKFLSIKKLFRNLAFTFLLCTLLFGCSTNTNTLLRQGYGEQALTLHGHQFSVELATTPETRERGLMFRESLPEERGMLFVFENPEQVSFWMKNTLIPLDLLYFDAEKKLVQIHANAEPCRADPCPIYSSDSRIKYVLELASGVTAKIGAEVGDEFALKE